MKVVGYIFTVFGALDTIISLLGIICGYSDAAVIQKLSGGMMVGFTGIMLIHFANKKQQDKEEHDKWERNKSS